MITESVKKNTKSNCLIKGGSRLTETSDSSDLPKSVEAAHTCDQELWPLHNSLNTLPSKTLNKKLEEFVSKLNTQRLQERLTV